MGRPAFANSHLLRLLDWWVLHNCSYQQHYSGKRNLSVSTLGICVLRFRGALVPVSMPPMQTAVIQAERMERKSVVGHVSALRTKEMDERRIALRPNWSSLNRWKV